MKLFKRAKRVTLIWLCLATAIAAFAFCYVEIDHPKTFTSNLIVLLAWLYAVYSAARLYIKACDYYDQYN